MKYPMQMEPNSTPHNIIDALSIVSSILCIYTFQGLGGSFLLSVLFDERLDELSDFLARLSKLGLVREVDESRLLLLFEAERLSSL